MGWTWLEEALAEEAKRTEDLNDPSYEDDSLRPEADPSTPAATREGIDWVRDENGDVVHPIQKRAKESLYALLDELRESGNPEEHHGGLNNFVAHCMTLSAKLAGALGGLARGGVEPDFGLTIASLKRALDVLHHALAAADALGRDAPFPMERVAHYRSQLFTVREEMLALMANLRGR